MKKKIMGILAVVAIAMLVGYNMYSSHEEMSFTNLAIVNIEALAQGESSGGNCEPSSSRECCVCNGVHYTYQASVNNSCSTESSCNHWN